MHSLLVDILFGESDLQLAILIPPKCPCMPAGRMIVKTSSLLKF